MSWSCSKQGALHSEHSPCSYDTYSLEEEIANDIINHYVYKMLRAANKNKGKQMKCRGAVLNKGVRKDLSDGVTLEQRPARRRGRPCKYLGGGRARWREQPVHRAYSRGWVALLTAAEQPA